MDDHQAYREFIREKLRSPQRAEAMSWLQADHNRTVWEHGNDESLAIAQQLYGLGAAEVTAVNFDGDVCCELLIRLPDDQHPRDSIFAWVAEQAASRGFDPDEDVGQECLYVFFT